MGDTPSHEEDEAEKQKESVKNSASSPSLKPPTPEPILLKTEPNLPSDPPKTPMEDEDDEAGQDLEEEKEEAAEETPPVKAEPIVTAPAAATPKPSYPGLQSQYGYMAPYMSPLVSMSNLAAMYQQQQHQQHHHQQAPQQQAATANGETPVPVVKTDPSTYCHPLDHYRQVSDEGRVPLDLLPDDVNAIMAQSTTPICPICNKDCTNFPNLRSHLQVHNNIRPYACTFCEAKFARVSHLNRHIRTHTGERPFACERCGKSFARQ